MDFNKICNYFIVRNGQIELPYQQVEPEILPIAERSLIGLTTSQGIGDLYRIYVVAKEHDIDFNAAFIPANFDSRATEPFDTKKMNRLYQLGYKLAKDGYPWQKVPPLYTGNK